MWHLILLTFIEILLGRTAQHPMQSPLFLLCMLTLTTAKSDMKTQEMKIEGQQRRLQIAPSPEEIAYVTAKTFGSGTAAEQQARDVLTAFPMPPQDVPNDQGQELTDREKLEQDASYLPGTARFSGDALATTNEERKAFLHSQREQGHRDINPYDAKYYDPYEAARQAQQEEGERIRKEKRKVEHDIRQSANPLWAASTAVHLDPEDFSEEQRAALSKSSSSAGWSGDFGGILQASAADLGGGMDETASLLAEDLPPVEQKQKCPLLRQKRWRGDGLFSFDVSEEDEQSVETCRDACEVHPDCVFFGFRRDRRRRKGHDRCELLSSGKETRENEDWVSGQLECLDSKGEAGTDGEAATLMTSSVDDRLQGDSVAAFRASSSSASETRGEESTGAAFRGSTQPREIEPSGEARVESVSQDDKPFSLFDRGQKDGSEEERGQEDLERERDETVLEERREEARKSFERCLKRGVRVAICSRSFAMAEGSVPSDLWDSFLSEEISLRQEEIGLPSEAFFELGDGRWIRTPVALPPTKAPDPFGTDIEGHLAKKRLFDFNDEEGRLHEEYGRRDTVLDSYLEKVKSQLREAEEDREKKESLPEATKLPKDSLSASNESSSSLPSPMQDSESEPDSLLESSTATQTATMKQHSEAAVEEKIRTEAEDEKIDFQLGVADAEEWTQTFQRAPGLRGSN
uniref:Apple domain-containing protein n=1 Tax=Chromera velia CCMP2878 TaxID=1169474 RepID=A0A0G4FE42_9ALVE|eukprot:Cvel_16440.t1-p1 / transcript=Cvel_16440.t1 / gene=Cvel_16440 / organism=Chromera_velia_CCMP2878 / gene_product=hypothetical protein / transcript_product=hypothetical protein / location=Cvel_scaffold1267:17329-21230(+) / protein_length=689 / sequence_SO=supercontig / SO=protein_coding / is_pseudo=false